MVTASKIRKGFFMIADISGYTSFLSETELEHAQEIIEEITRLLLDHIQPPFKLVKLEGDAVFYYVPQEMLPEPERLLEHIEACYCDFASHMQYAKRLTHCRCRACASMHTLDLKFFAHYGEYMIQKVPGTSEDIAGRDVILLHRLLKNSVTERMGLRGYALLTNACLEKIGKSSFITPHTESYEHIGEVECGVYDLHAYEYRMRDTKRVYLESKDADYIYERILSASPELLWSFIIDPERRMQYQIIKELKPVRNNSGRLGVGAEFHCDHGAFTRITRMLDWRPFHYMTNVTVQSFNKLPLKAPESMVTFELIPVDAGHTKLSFRVRSLRRDWFTVQFLRRIAKHVFNKENNSDYDRLDKVLAKMQSEDKPADGYLQETEPG
jgi:uncharacterized protein YndB with AHSA1/START domain